MALTLLLSKARPPSKSTTTWDAYTRYGSNLGWSHSGK